MFRFAALLRAVKKTNRRQYSVQVYNENRTTKRTRRYERKTYQLDPDFLIRLDVCTYDTESKNKVSRRLVWVESTSRLRIRASDSSQRVIRHRDSDDDDVAYTRLWIAVNGFVSFNPVLRRRHASDNHQQSKFNSSDSETHLGKCHRNSHFRSSARVCTCSRPEAPTRRSHPSSSRRRYFSRFASSVSSAFTRSRRPVSGRLRSSDSTLRSRAGDRQLTRLRVRGASPRSSVRCDASVSRSLG